MDGALTFTHICVDSSRAVLEHLPFISVLTKAEQYIQTTKLILSLSACGALVGDALVHVDGLH